MWQRSLVTVPYIVITRHYARAIDEQKSVIPVRDERKKKKERKRGRERRRERDKKENRANTMYHRLAVMQQRVLCIVILSRWYTRSTMKLKVVPLSKLPRNRRSWRDFASLSLSFSLYLGSRRRGRGGE